MATLYAAPYNVDVEGFYFDDYETFEEAAEELTDKYGQPVEEFVIQYIGGDNPKLFEAAGIDQSTLELWFDELDHIGDYEDDGYALRWLMDKAGYNLQGALAKYPYVIVSHGTASDYAEEVVRECYGLPEGLSAYFNYDSFAADLEREGAIAEFEDVVITNASEL